MNRSMNLMQLAAMMQRGDPIAALQQMAATNPQAAQALQIIQGKSPEQLRQIATNMARERGTTIEQVKQQLGIK